jgi:ABC-2 type transport system permease protein
MTRYLQLFRRTFELSASVMLIYRANVVFFLLFELVFLAAQFLTVSVGFDLAGGDVAGWTKEQAYLLTAVNGLSHQIFICFFINAIFSLGMHVWNGQFDYILLKPLHPLLSLWFNGQFVISNLPTLVVNAVAVAVLLARGVADPAVIPAFVVLFGLGIAVRVALSLVCIAPIFLSERLGDVEDSFWAVTSLARYPMSIYPRAMIAVMTFVVPIGMLASIPSAVLFGRHGAGELVGACAASVVFVWVGQRIFMMSLKRYQSVNSGV